MATPALKRLKEKYSAALYSYFRVTNLAESCHLFLQDPTKPPQFEYRKSISASMAMRRLKNLQEDLDNVRKTDFASISFLQWRIAETKVLIAFWKIRNQSNTPSEEQVEEFIELQKNLYGSLDENLFGGIIRNLRIVARRKSAPHTQNMQEIEDRLAAAPEGRLFSPKDRTFMHYKRLWGDRFDKLNKVLASIRTAQNYSIEEIARFFEKALLQVGGDKEGWVVVIDEGGANVAVSRYKKKIIIGRYFRPTSTIRLKQIIAHEVACHVQRALTDQKAYLIPGFDESDEGLAIMVEQLFASRFMYKRAIRYLAICLAAGLDGKKRNFSEVYDILWRVMYIVGGKESIAREQAFYETARVFRGGAPDIPGVAYIKDKVYLESNLRVWQKLEDTMLGSKAFARLFNGHNHVYRKMPA